MSGARLTAVAQRWLTPRLITAIVGLVVVDRVVLVDPYEEPPATYTLDLLMTSSTDGVSQVFYDVGRGFNVHDMAQVDVTAGETPRAVSFPLRHGRLRRVRLDFLMGPGRVTLADIHVAASDGRMVLSVASDALRPNHQVSELVADANRVTAVAPEGVNDPYLIAEFAEPLELRAHDRPWISRHHTARLGMIVVGGLALAALWSIGGARWPGRASAVASFLGARHVGVAALALFAIVWGVKLVTIHRFGAAVPNWDQWDAEGAALFRPWLEGTLRFSDWFVPHNEHRIVCTKALSLLILGLNGQWDARLEMVVNAALHAALAAVAFRWGCGYLRGFWRVPWFLALAALTAPPWAWQNVLGGFHSQQYFLLGTSLAAIALLATREPWTRGWWGGVACASLALFTMGSGLLAAAAIGALLVAGERPRTLWTTHWPTLLACALIIAIGWALRVEVAGHNDLAARSLRDFLLTFWRNLQWPATSLPWYPVVAWAPWSWLAVRVLARRPGLTAADRVIVGAGIWVLLQFLATGWLRGAGAPWPASRYFDTVTVGIAINLAATLRGLTRAEAPARRRLLEALVPFAAIAILVPTGWRAGLNIWRGELPGVGAALERRTINTRAYLASGDTAWLRSTDIPYPNPDVLIAHLRPEAIRRILPAEVRPPVELVPAAAPAPAAFVPRGLPPDFPLAGGLGAWGSQTPDGVATRGTWRSEPVSSSRLPYWRFLVAGDRGSLAVQLPDGQTRLLASGAAGGATGWRSCTLAAPPAGSVVVAADHSASGWFAFCGPYEMARGSWWAERTSAHGSMVIALGIWLGAIVFVPARLRRDTAPREQPASPAPESPPGHFPHRDP